MVKSQGVSLLLVTDGKKKKTNLSLLRIVEKKWFDKSKTLKDILRLRGTNQVKAILWKGRPVRIVIVNHGPAAIAGPGPGHGKNRAELLQRNFTCTVEHPASIRHGWAVVTSHQCRGRGAL